MIDRRIVINKKRARLNSEIKVSEVRLIDADGEQCGIVSIEEAKSKAKDSGMDLVEISPSAVPPVCRIMDYNKFNYQQQKKQAEAKKKQKKVQIKELKFRPGTEEGDLQVKIRKLREFLEAGDKVKITVRFRGREMAHRDLTKVLFDRITHDVVDMGVVELAPKYEGRQVIMVLAPKKSV